MLLNRGSGHRAARSKEVLFEVRLEGDAMV
jgi:hypothetical protein